MSSQGTFKPPVGAGLLLLMLLYLQVSPAMAKTTSQFQHWYMISVVVCRMVLMYELAGLRDAYMLSHPELMVSQLDPFQVNKEGKGRGMEESNGSQATGKEYATRTYYSEETRTR